MDKSHAVILDWTFLHVLNTSKIYILYITIFSNFMFQYQLLLSYIAYRHTDRYTDSKTMIIVGY